MRFNKVLMVVALAGVCTDATHAQSTAPISTARHPLELYANPQQLVKLLNGRTMNILCTGSGSPTVLLEAGAGDSNWIWTPIQRGVARTNRVCSYDRAAMGFSEFASDPRTPANIASDLTLLLKTADINGPFVLVGHSAGGIYARAFADLHRKEIVGMVLVEPVGINQDNRLNEAIPSGGQRQAEAKRVVEACAAAAESGALQKASLSESIRNCVYTGEPSFPASLRAALKRTRESAAYLRTVLSEDEEENASDVSARAGSYGDVPLIVLTASNSGDEFAFSPDELIKFKKLRIAMHEELAALSSRGIHRQIPEASHYVIIEKPGVIVAAISEVIAASK
jgi:pimeloyl-ACP methyl ester carboxylesterase